MKTIPAHFTYVYRLRMRPNAYPKPIYQGAILIDTDAPFAPIDIKLMFDGRQDECAVIRDRYRLTLGRGGGSPIFQPGAAVPLVLARDYTRPPKLRKRRDGGAGVNIEVWIQGLKQYPNLAAHFSTETAPKV
jgi:hypothetical protein